MKLKFYYIENSYIQFLRNFDNKVTIIKSTGKTRPYVGIVYSINTYEYFAPLSSPKYAQNGTLSMKYKNKYKDKKSPLFEPINDLKHGTIQINNMIPVPSSELIKFDIKNVQDSDYRSLLLNQYIYIDNNKKTIYKKAKRLYDFVTKHEIPKFINLSCDFKLLEEKCDEYP
ncbi:MAG TPA: type III toxin-antitoxin system ToxN/AbiQ family toxin [Thermotogota bacterium]|nr:type III toxin-antitoxin system ToxN/AbiQ family toxin [Thermotogota bacterium]